MHLIILFMDELNSYIDYVVNEKAALFIGAGLSRICGCKGWDDICTNLYKACEDKLKVSESEFRLAKPDEKMTFVKKILDSDDGRPVYQHILRNGLNPDPELLVKKYIPLIKSIRTIHPHPKIVTTNPDTCLKLSGQYNDYFVFHKLCDLTSHNFDVQKAIFHIHGSREETDAEVWSIPQYQERYSDAKFCEFIKHIFTNYSVLFLGYGLREAPILRIISTVVSKCPQHYALLPSDSEVLPQKSIFQEIYKISLIDYGNKSTLRNRLQEWISLNFDTVLSGDETNADRSRI